MKRLLYPSLTAEEQGLVDSCRDFFTKVYVTGEVRVEERLDLADPATGEVLTFGTADLVIDAGQTLLVIDWKFGRKWPPETFLSWQCRLYAAMALQAFPDAEDCAIWVFAPRLDTKYHGELRRTEVAAVVEGYKAAVAACQGDEIRLVGGPEQCEYCKSVAFCLGAAKFSRDLIAAEDRSVATGARLAALMDSWTVAKRHGEALERMVNDRLAKDPDSIPGWRRKGVAGRREIADLGQAALLLSDVISRDEFIGCLRPSTSELERLFVDKYSGDGVKKAEAKKTFWARLGEIVTRKPQTTRLERVKEG